MKARIDARAGAEGKDDLKLGKGGIREAEFFVSALQLLHGGRDETRALRERAVLPALDRLLFAGVVPAKDRDELADAYLFLRRAEHRVQMLDGAQTHRLPPAGRAARARPRHGLRDRGGVRGGARRAPRAGGAALRRPPRHGRPARSRSTPSSSLLADAQVERERRAEIAARRGLVDPDRVLAAIDAMARRRTPFSPLGDPAAAVALLSDALGTPDPDQAISHLSDFAAALAEPGPVLPHARASTGASRGSCSRCSAPPTSSRSASSATPSSSTCCSARTRCLLEKGAGRLPRGARGAARATSIPALPVGRPPRAPARRAAALQERGGPAHRDPRHRRHHRPRAASRRQLTDLAEVCLERCLALAEARGAREGDRPARAAVRHRHGQARRPRARLPLRPRPHLRLSGWPCARRRPPVRSRALPAPRPAAHVVPADAAARGAALPDRHAPAPVGQPGRARHRRRGVHPLPRRRRRRARPARCGASSGSGRRSCARATWPATRRSSRSSRRR